MIKVAILICVLLLLCSLSSAQYFGGNTRTFGGGFSSSVGYRAGPAWASISQSRNFHGMPSPVSLSGGADFFNRRGSGVSGSLNHVQGFGGQGILRGQLGLVSNDKNQLTGWAEHQRSFDKNFKEYGSPTNSFGVDYTHASGANAFISGSKTGSSPVVGTIGGGIPLFTSKDGNTKLSIGGQSSFAHGMKPQNQVDLKLESNF